MEENSIIEEALPILRNNVDTICTVGEWAEQTGYSRTHFSMLIRREFDDTPYSIICREKFQKVCQLVRNNPSLKGVVIAREAGFSDVKALYKFLSNHFNTTLTSLRKRL